MPHEQHGAHGECIELGSKAYFVRRDFDLAMRIEERCGPFAGILGDIVEGGRNVGRLRVGVIADVLEEALRGQVTRAEIEAHIMDAGIMRAMIPVATLIRNFFLGDERFQARLEAVRGEADPRQAASSHGQTYLERQQS